MIIIKNLVVFDENQKNIILSINELVIKKSDVFFIHGKSGSGKSTFLKVLANEYFSFSGNIILDEKIIEDYTEEQYFKKVQYIGHTYPLFLHMTIYEQFLHLLSYVKDDFLDDSHKVIEKHMTALSLWAHRDKYSKELSGGQRQRAAIIQKVLLNSPYLILDEPTVNLDRESKFELLYYLTEFNKNGHTLIIATHDDEVISFFDNKNIFYLPFEE